MKTDPLQLVMILRRRIGGLPRTFRELDRSLSVLGDLRTLGWQPSVNRGAAVEASGAPIPWYTYPAIWWLKDKIRATDRVFEWGAGHSTIWYASRVQSVVAVDDSTAWVTEVASRVGTNCTVWLREGPSYVDSIAHAGGTFDIVCIDGLDRSACAAKAVEFLDPMGAIIFDNSDHPRNYAGLELLRDSGFQRIDFVGPIPAYGNFACTSVLFRDGSRWLSAKKMPDFLGY